VTQERSRRPGFTGRRDRVAEHRIAGFSLGNIGSVRHRGAVCLCLRAHKRRWVKNCRVNGTSGSPANAGRGPGRPRNRPVDAEYEALVDAAVQVFGRRGRGAATVDEIARVAGIKKASVYAHFTSRDDLLLAADSAALERLSVVMTQAYEESRHLAPADRVRLQIAGFIDYVESDPDACELIMSGERRAHRDTETDGSGAVSPARDSIISAGSAIIAEEMVAAGLAHETAADRAPLMATMLLGMVEFTARRRLAHPQWDRESVISFLTQATMGGIAGVDPGLSLIPPASPPPDTAPLGPLS
jgi:AcrR family transcriptional regulator